MGHETKIDAAYNAIKARLTGLSYTVVEGSPWRYSSCPFVIMHPPRIRKEPLDYGDYSLTAEYELGVCIRETAPTNWLTDVLSKLCAIADALESGGNLAGACDWCYVPEVLSAELQTGNLLYFGGVMVIKVVQHYP